jgi:hypothetical protein
MKSFFLFFFFLVTLNTVSSKNIIFGTSGIAKVGQACFASIVIKDETDLNIQKLQLNIFSTNESQKLIGKSNIIFQKLNKNQPYVTSVPIELENTEECKDIKNIKIHVSNCIIDKQMNQKCNSLLKIKEKFKDSFLVNTTVIEDSSFFNTDNTKLYLKEFGIFLKKLNSDYARRYKIKNNTSGLLVVGVSSSNTFIEGDLITEVEMAQVRNISQLKKQLKEIFDNKKQHILINFIRDNNEKLVAVKIN